MKKIFFSTFYILIFLTIISIFYLTFFGYETKRFNETIKSIINKNDENIGLTFEKVKVSLDIKKFSIYVKLTKPNLNYYENQIPLDSLKADINLLSLIKNENSINKIIASTNYLNFKSIKPIIIRSKPGNFKTILLNNVKSSEFKIYSEIKFNENLEIAEGSIFKGDFKKTIVHIKEEYLIKDISFDFNYNNQLLNLTNIKANLEQFEIYDSNIDYYNSREKDYKIDGQVKARVNSTGNNIKKILSLTDTDIENLDFTSLKGSASSSFNLKLDKTLKIKKNKFDISASVDDLQANFKKKINGKFLSEDLKNIHLKEATIQINIEDDKSITKFKSKIKTSNEFFNVDISKKMPENSTNFSITGKSPIKIPVINYSYENDQLNLTGRYYENNKNLIFSKINYEVDDNIFKIENLVLNKELDLINFDKLSVISKLNGKINNNFIIKNSDKNKINIKGSIFDAKLLVKEFSNKSENNFFKNISKDIEIDLDKILTDTDFPLNKFRLIGNIKKGKFEKISGKSEFIDNRYLDISLKREKDTNFKILEIHSDVARPLLNSYKFFDGLNKGNLIFESRFDDKNSISTLRVNNFKIVNAPAFATLLSLADFKGLTDSLKGEGISFDTLVIKYNTDPKIMRIEEIFMIGPSISILIEGYVEKESDLISLRGTLVPAKTLNTLLSKIPLVGHILIGKKDGEGLFGVSFKIKGLPDQLKTTVNPVKSLTPRFITRALESIKKKQSK